MECIILDRTRREQNVKKKISDDIIFIWPGHDNLARNMHVFSWYDRLEAFNNKMEFIHSFYLFVYQNASLVTVKKHKILSFSLLIWKWSPQSQNIEEIAWWQNFSHFIRNKDIRYSFDDNDDAVSVSIFLFWNNGACFISNNDNFRNNVH